jgi:hypothetical protein
MYKKLYDLKESITLSLILCYNFAGTNGNKESKITERKK